MNKIITCRLKITKYKNYGMTFTSHPDDMGDEHRFFWSFYELNNSKIIVLQHIEHWNKIFIHDQFEFSYGQYVLNNGNELKYEFGEDFDNWFDNQPKTKGLLKINYPTEEEKHCIKEFYLMHIEHKKLIESDIIIINSHQL